MKIGIITYWDTIENYGQVLQSFALQQYLRNYNHDPYLIRYEYKIPGEKASFKWTRIFHYLFKLPTYVSWFINERALKRKHEQSKAAAIQNDRHFSDFKAAFMKNSECIYNEKTIYVNPPQADAYICGSDQIWGGEGAYYLDFAPDDKPKIAYAPSLGGIKSFSEAYEKQMKTWIDRLSFVGMREKSGVSLCHRIGKKDAVQVVDPTLLLEQKDYDRIRKTVDTDKPYLLLYVLGNPMSCSLEEIFSYAEERNLEVKFIASSGQIDNHEHIYPEVGEWIDLIANADIVITNSFHGTVFSIIYERPFINIPLNNGFERMNTRNFELLEACDLSSQIYKGNLYDIPSSNIDFSTFRKYRAAEEKRSRSFINKFIPLEQ